MSSTTAPAHRSVAGIRSTSIGLPGSPTSPHTPVRTISSTHGSPSALRAEEDCVVIELGARFLRAGLAGDAVPKAVIDCGPEQQRRAGDCRRWGADYEKDWKGRVQGKDWGDGHELWKLDLRNLDLGLVGDKIERAIRESFTKYLLIDSRPRKLALALPSILPLPLLSTVLDTIFTNFQSPTISLFPAPALSAVAAGLRSALVVDIGWAETVVTSLYEFREVNCRHSVRGSKKLGEEVHKMLLEAAYPDPPQQGASSQNERDISFDDCQEVITRMMWCSPIRKKETREVAGLSTVEEEEELTPTRDTFSDDSPFVAGSHTALHLKSLDPPRILQIPVSKLSGTCESALLARGIPSADLDDDELPIHLLVYHSLLQLPVDVRSICMSRIIFVGGGSNIPGLKSRILDEVTGLFEDYGWDPARGNAIEALKKNPKRRTQAVEGPIEVSKLALAEPDPDPIEEQLRCEANKGVLPIEHGSLRALESLGAWSGASLLSQLKVPAVSIIDLEQWLSQGAAGASKPGEVSVVPNQRQSMGSWAFKSGGGERPSWTLGLWG